MCSGLAVATLRSSKPFMPRSVTQYREFLFKAQEAKCAFCSQVCVDAREDVENSFTIEHVIPKAYGGSNSRTNLVGCCKKCNQARAVELQAIEIEYKKNVSKALRKRWNEFMELKGFSDETVGLD